MSTETYISSSCVINDGVVYKNGRPVFENRNSGISAFLLSVYRHLNTEYPKFHKMDNLSKLGWLANEALLQRRFDPAKYKPEDVGIVLSNASSSLDTDIKYYKTTKEIASPALFVYTLPNIVIGEISIRHKFKGENAFFIFEDFETGFIQQYVSNLLNNDILQCCICGWIEMFEENYKAALFLVEKDKSADSVIFTKENLTKIYQLQDG